MEDFREEHGYALDASGQGPYAVFCRLHTQPLRATTVSGVRTGSTDSEAAVEGTGLLSEYYAVSVVTPEEPAVDPLSAEVFNDFLESFGALGRP